MLTLVKSDRIERRKLAEMIHQSKQNIPGLEDAARSQSGEVLANTLRSLDAWRSKLAAAEKRLGEIGYGPTAGGWCPPWIADIAEGRS